MRIIHYTAVAGTTYFDPCKYVNTEAYFLEAEEFIPLAFNAHTLLILHPRPHNIFLRMIVVNKDVEYGINVPCGTALNAVLDFEQIEATFMLPSSNTQPQFLPAEQQQQPELESEQ